MQYFCYVPKLGETDDVEQQQMRFNGVARVLHEAEGFYSNIARHRKLLTHLDTLTRVFFCWPPSR